MIFLPPSELWVQLILNSLCPDTNEETFVGGGGAVGFIVGFLEIIFPSELIVNKAFTTYSLDIVIPGLGVIYSSFVIKLSVYVDPFMVNEE